MDEEHINMQMAMFMKGHLRIDASTAMESILGSIQMAQLKRLTKVNGFRTNDLVGVYKFLKV